VQGRTEVRLSRNPRHRRSSACPRLCTTTRPVPGGLRSRKTGLAPGLGHEFWWVIYLLKKRDPTRPPLLNETVPSHSGFVASTWNFWTKSRRVLRSCPVPRFVSRPAVRVRSHLWCPVPTVQGSDALGKPGQSSWARCLHRLWAHDTRTRVERANRAKAEAKWFPISILRRGQSIRQDRFSTHPEDPGERG
jgi:hypothetical protein